MKRLGSLLMAALLSAVLLSGCSTTEVVGVPSSGVTAKLTGTLKFAGSSSMADIVNSLSEEFKAQNPGVLVTVDQQGSGSAITGLNDGTAQIGNLSRDVKPEENKDGKYEVIGMAIDGIAVVVNTKNTIGNLTIDQISGIFKGEITNWKDVGGMDQTIYVVGREEGSGTRDGFEELVKAKGVCKYGAVLKESGDVVSKVSSTDSAIGYISYASLNEKTKALTIGGVQITDETIADGSYKLQRPFVQAFRKDTDNELVLAYLEFLKSDKAQSLIKEEKLIPIEFWKQ